MESYLPIIWAAIIGCAVAMYVIVYLIVFGAGIYYMARVARAGPPEHVDFRDARLHERPARPLSGAEA